MEHIITLDHVSVRYGKTMALQEVSGVFHEGSLTAIAGPNGAGKSTLLKTIAGILKPTRGQITIQKKYQNAIGYLPQTATIQRDFPINVLQAVLTGFWPKIHHQKAITSAMKNKALEALKQVGLEGFETREISSLSGGQFQRMLFARVIIQDAKVILLDEPFTAVDAETTAKLIQILLMWHREKRTIICVLHDLLLIKKYFPESFILAGKCLGSGHTHRMFEENLLSFDLDMAEMYINTKEESLQHQHDAKFHKKEKRKRK